MALMRELLADLPVTFGRPWWLLAIPLLIPPLVWMSRRSLAGMGTFRRWLAILLRVAVITLVVLALAETRAVKRRDALTTLFLIDTSESMPIEWRARVFDFIGAAEAQFQRPGRSDRLRPRGARRDSAGARAAADRAHREPRRG
jgi:hypothetical protein